MADRRGRAVSVDTAQRLAGRGRNLNQRGQPSYAPLPVTRDRLHWHSTVADSDNAFLPGQWQPNISESQAIEFRKSRRQVYANSSNQPSHQERTELLVHARRSQSVGARYAATVGFRGDANSTLALHPMNFPRPLLTKDYWPAQYTQENIQAHQALIAGAAQPELPLSHEGAPVNLKEPETAESDLFMDELFDFDAAIEGIEAIGRAKEADATAIAGVGAGDAGGEVDEDMMEEL